MVRYTLAYSIENSIYYTDKLTEKSTGQHVMHHIRLSILSVSEAGFYWSFKRNQ